MQIQTESRLLTPEESEKIKAHVSGLNVSELCRRIGVTKSSFYNLLRGTSPRVEIIPDIIEVSGIMRQEAANAELKRKQAIDILKQ